MVDDSDVQRAHTTRLLRSLGVDCIHHVSSGTEALAVLGDLRPRPGLIVLDLEMPGIRGIELLEQLPIKDIPIIMASSSEQRLLDSVQILGSDLKLNIVAALLKAALGQGDLRVRHQPQVEMRSGRVIGLEALALGCDLAQGWLIAKALRPAEIPAWLASSESLRSALSHQRPA